MPGEDIKVIKEKLKELETRVKMLEEKKELLGFKLIKRKDSYWYAYRKIKNKVEWVYIGKDKNKADMKIIRWLNKKLQKAK